MSVVTNGDKAVHAAIEKVLPYSRSTLFMYLAL